MDLDDVTFKKLVKILPDNAALREISRKIAFSHFVNRIDDGTQWECCGISFQVVQHCQRHVSDYHGKEVDENAGNILIEFNRRLERNSEEDKDNKLSFSNTEICAEMMTFPAVYECICNDLTFKILLFYHYVDITCTSRIVKWQNWLCQKLKLNGKIRIATEGINGTVEGCVCATQFYIMNLLKYFTSMVKEDFKISKGDGNGFDELKISECEELCSIGITSDELKASDGGSHLSPAEFHKEIDHLHYKEDTVLLDCRNFYESKIGHFELAIRPNLRKFSYFPGYFDKNAGAFKDKRVLMYCTGGIRCERASAYMKKTGICKEVLQLKGGIHKYLEEYPDGHYKGKLFVFDNRYSIGGESETPVSSCKYCGAPYDQYQLCTSSQCRQLVLSCDACRQKGKTACCDECFDMDTSKMKEESRKQECQCTKSRDQIPVEKNASCQHKTACAMYL